MNVQPWEGQSTRVVWLRLMIENSNNIRLKKSTLDTLLLRTYKQTEFLCTHINKHSSGDDGCCHLFTASDSYPGVVEAPGVPGSREAALRRALAAGVPPARLRSLRGDPALGSARPLGF